jgi:hypothetical protein
VGHEETGDTTWFEVVLKKVGVLGEINRFCGRNEHVVK